MKQCILAPVSILTLKTMLAIKGGLALFGMGLSLGYLFNSSQQKQPLDDGTPIDEIEPQQESTPAKRQRTKK